MSNQNMYKNLDKMKNMLNVSLIDILIPQIKSNQNENVINMLDIVKDKPDVEIEKADSEALVIKTKLTVEPEVTIENYMGIAIKPVSTEVTDEDIEAEIKKVR